MGAWTLEPDRQGLNPGSATYELRNLEQVTWPLYASVSSSVRWGWCSSWDSRQRGSEREPLHSFLFGARFLERSLAEQTCGGVR